jgi:hypothetical protein
MRLDLLSAPHFMFTPMAASLHVGIPGWGDSRNHAKHLKRGAARGPRVIPEGSRALYFPYQT